MDEKKEILYDVKNIKTSESYTLPSKGLVYDEKDGIPASITLRRMTTKEDKMRMRNQSEDKIRRDILDACITTEGVSADKLKLSDANFLLFRLRVLSLLDDTYKVQIVCPNCGTTYIHEVKLSEVPVNYMNEDKLNILSIELPICKAKISLKQPSLKDMITMSEKLQEYFDKFPNADRAEAIYTTSAMLYVKEINGKSMLSEELEDWIDNLDIIDNREFRKKLISVDGMYGLDDNLSCKCPSCSFETTHGLPITNELFNPSL